MKSAVLNVSGSGNLDGGNVIGAAKLTSTGSGNIDLGEINGDLVYEGRGSSNLSLERLDGRASVTMSGSGNVDIDDGEIPDLMISSRGSSAFDFGGTAGDAAVIVSGSGDVDIDDATGTRDVKSSGSAAVKIGTKAFGSTSVMNGHVVLLFTRTLARGGLADGAGVRPVAASKALKL